MYLTESIDDVPMVGVFEGHTRLTSKLQRFGYIDIALKEDCLLGKAGDRLTAHEFHKSISDVEGQPLYTITKALGVKTWECGYRYKNVLAGYPHLSFLGNLKAFETLLTHVNECT
jgi:cobyrinic acid a,c-diamide synthase